MIYQLANYITPTHLGPQGSPIPQVTRYQIVAIALDQHDFDRQL